MIARNSRIPLAVFCSVLLLTGCDSRFGSSASIETSPSANSSPDPSEADGQPATPDKTASGTTSEAVAQSNAPELSPSTWERIGKLYQQAVDSGETQAKNASQWMNDLWQSTSASSSEISQQSQRWLTAQYLEAKEAGTTTAGNVNQYFQEELNKIGAWEYQTLQCAGEPEELNKILNQHGSQRWECFAVTTNQDVQLLYLRRKVKSDFDNIPTGDLVRNIMTMAGAGMFTGSGG